MEIIFHKKQLKKIEIFIIKNKQQIKFQLKLLKQISLVTAALNIHLNIGQNMKMNSSSVLMSLEKSSFESLSNKLIEQVGNAQIHIPSDLDNNGTVSLRVCSLSFIYTLSIMFF
jgi:hypothetical protein